MTDHPTSAEFEPMTVIAADDPNVGHGYTGGCPHCPDGHYPSDKRTWAVWLGDERDGDGQPVMIHVARPDGAHASEADADWIRQQLNPHLRETQ